MYFELMSGVHETKTVITVKTIFIVYSIILSPTSTVSNQSIGETFLGLCLYHVLNIAITTIAVALGVTSSPT